MAATPGSPSSTTESRHSGAPTSTMVDDAENDSMGPDPFGPEVPTEDGGVVALAGWSMVAAVVGVVAVIALAATMMRRRRRPKPTATEIAQNAVSDLIDRSRAESRAMRRRVARRVAHQIEAAA